MNFYVAFDLHSDNAYGVIIDEAEKVVYRHRFATELESILKTLEQYRTGIRGITVESTFNWYWLVDGLLEAGYKVELAHSTAVKANSMKKRTNDFDDALCLAKLLKSGKLPTGYIYPKETRPLRDLMRKRGFLVKSRTSYILNFINLVNRNLGIGISSAHVKMMSDEKLEALLDQEYLLLSGKANLSTIKHLNNQISILEEAILQAGQLLPQFQILLSIPGVGKVIALTIAYEAGNLERFEEAGDYISYCRCVDSANMSNDKQKGSNNRKNGNEYLCWAYVEAANFAKRYCPYARAYYKYKLKESGVNALAIKSLAAKLARASFFMMGRNEPYDPERAFGRFKAQAKALIAEKKAVAVNPERGLV